MRHCPCHIIFLFFVVVMGVSCRPNGVLSSGKMEQALLALHRTDGVVYAKNFQYGHDAEVVRLYQATLDELGITQAQFDSSLVWYTDHPQIFNKMYPKIVAQLEAELEVCRQLPDDLVSVKSTSRTLREIDDILSIYRYGLHHDLYLPPEPIPYYPFILP